MRKLFYQHKTSVVLLILLFLQHGVCGKSARELIQESGIRGGLISHIGCGDGTVTAGLCSNEKIIIHGIDRNAMNVGKARSHIGSLGISGNISISHWDGERLPYIDNLINIAIVEDAAVDMKEVMRSLVPYGTAYIKKGGDWEKTVKPWNPEYREWTHYLNGPDNNAVTKDSLVGPPRHIQWLSDPLWTRHHDKLASISTVVTAKGRIYYIGDTGPLSDPNLPAKWFLTSRDAFNGALLWEKEISSWVDHLRKFRSGPVQVGRVLVAKGDDLFVQLGIDEPVSVLDGASGALKKVFHGTEKAEEFILNEGTLYVITAKEKSEQSINDEAVYLSEIQNSKSLVAVNISDGKIGWKWPGGKTADIAAQTLTASGNKVFLQNGSDTVAISSTDGRELWRTAVVALPANEGKVKKNLIRTAGWAIMTLVAYKDTVLFADGTDFTAMSADTGKILWKDKAETVFGKVDGVDLFVANDLVWTSPDFSKGRDFATGKVVKENTVMSDLLTAGHHHRCYRNKASENYLMIGYRGIEFVDLKADRHSRNNWLRGLCQYGIMPANGLIYAPPHNCGCYSEAKLFGFWAVAGERETAADAGNELIKGPAFGRTDSKHTINEKNEWPVFRQNEFRGGSIPMEIPSTAKPEWSTQIGGKLSSPVIAGKTVMVSSIDEHKVTALDSDNGKVKWSFLTGGRVDSAPSIYKDLVIFGSKDGWVYCLRLTDGQLVWRFRASPGKLNTVVRDQLESVWPVHGSVLIKDGLVYTTAGRSSYLDGGICLYALEAASGKVVYKNRLESDPAGIMENKSGKELEEYKQNAFDYKTYDAPDQSDAFSMTGGNISDILTSDGTSVYLRWMKFNDKLEKQDTFGRHLYSTARLIDEHHTHRSHWVLGTGDLRKLGVAYEWLLRGDRIYKSTFGTFIAFDENNTWAITHTVSKTKSMDYKVLYRSNTPFDPEEIPGPDIEEKTKRKDAVKNSYDPIWENDLHIFPNAMINAGNSLIIGGAQKNFEEISEEGVIMILDAADGKKTREIKLESGVAYNGISAAYNRIYVSLNNGKLLCIQ